MGKLNNKKIFITGGHAATTALSVVEEILEREQKHPPKLYWIGPKYAIQGTKVPTLASEILHTKGVEFVPIIAGRFLRKLNRWILLSIVKVPIGFAHALWIIIRKRPDLILSFGGYAAIPVVVMGWLMRVRIVIHDETYSFNRSNKLTELFADKICLSRNNSLKYYKKEKSIVIGNPMLKSIGGVKVKTKLSKNVTIYITGGSSGSKSINEAVLGILEKLLGKYTIIHQTGRLDFEKFKNIKKEFPVLLRNKYKVFPSVSPFNVHEIFERADIIVSRAGANTVSEIILTKRPAILIPLVIGDWNEQRKNAEYAKEFGVARIIDQNVLTPDRLFLSIQKLLSDWNNLIKGIKTKESPDRNADKRLVDILEQTMN